MYEGFREQRVTTSGAEIFLRTAGSGPPLVLVHGYPQTHSIVAPHRARAGGGVHGGRAGHAGVRPQLQAPRR